MENLSNMIRSERAKKHLSQTELANVLHISKAAVNGYENGKLTPTTKKMIVLADFFGCSVDWLLGRTERRK